MVGDVVVRSKARWSLLVLALALSLLGSWAVAQSPFGGGDGSPGAPFIISTTDHLEALRASPSDYASSHFLQTADLNFAADPKSPNGGVWDAGIGTATHPFTGSYDGGGYEMSNLIISSSDVNYNIDSGGVRTFTGGTGLFGVVSAGTIKNLRVDNVTVTGHSVVGVLIGWMRETSVTDVTILYSSVSASDRFAGGLVVASELLPITNPPEDPVTLCPILPFAVVTDVVVSATDVEGLSEVGGLIGYGSSVRVSGAHAHGNITRGAPPSVA